MTPRVKEISPTEISDETLSQTLNQYTLITSAQWRSESGQGGHFAHLEGWKGINQDESERDWGELDNDDDGYREEKNVRK